MTVHSQLTWKLRRIPQIALPSALRLPHPSEDAFAPMYVQAALAALLALAMVTGGVLLAAKLLTPAETPFIAYEEIFPGAPKQAIVEQGFTCQPGYNAAKTEFCSHYPSSGVFSHVGVWVANDVSHRITFTIRKDAFRLGDLPWAWDREDIAHTRLGYRLSLSPDESSLKVSARVESGEFSPFLPLQSVSFVMTP